MPSDDDRHCLVHTTEASSSEAVDGVEEVAHSLDEQDIPLNEVVINSHETDLSRAKVLCYSVGHFYNDLCASMWFTYLLIFMEKVVKLQSWQAGLLMLIGQVTDALSTPVVGLLSDASFLPGFLKNFGRRKPWHIIGTFCVTISFPLIFGSCLLCVNPDLQWTRIFWYIPFIMVFQFGWAVVQISHLSMIPELSKFEHTRMSMTSYRYGFTVIANLFIFSLLFLFLNTDGQGSAAIGPQDMANFRDLGLITICLGLYATCLFYIGIKEPTDQRRLSRLNSMGSEHSLTQSLQIVKMSWRNWLVNFKFYQSAALYLFARVYINISQIYIPFYITQTHGKGKMYVAMLPLTAYLSSFLVSCLLGSATISKMVKGKGLFMCGALLGSLNCVALYFPLPFPEFEIFDVQVALFGVVIFLGVTQAILLISSLNTTALLINLNTESGAFVYGAMSFVDKISNGIIVQIVELFNPSCHDASSETCAGFYRDVIVFIPGTCALAIFLLLLFMEVSSLGIREPQQRTTARGPLNVEDDEELLIE